MWKAGRRLCGLWRAFLCFWLLVGLAWPSGLVADGLTDLSKSELIAWIDRLARSLKDLEQTSAGLEASYAILNDQASEQMELLQAYKRESNTLRPLVEQLRNEVSNGKISLSAALSQLTEAEQHVNRLSDSYKSLKLLVDRLSAENAQLRRDLWIGIGVAGGVGLILGGIAGAILF